MKCGNNCALLGNQGAYWANTQRTGLVARGNCINIDYYHNDQQSTRPKGVPPDYQTKIQGSIRESHSEFLIKGLDRENIRARQGAPNR